MTRTLLVAGAIFGTGLLPGPGPVPGVGLLPLAGPPDAVAQEPEPEEEGGEAEGGEAILDREAPEMAEPPLQFKVAVAAGLLRWKETAERPDLDDGALLGLDVESEVGRFAAFRLSGAYGRTSAAAGGMATDVNQYVADLAGVLRLGAEPLVEAGVVPFGVLAVATVVHDPVDEELITKSQSAWGFGAGVDLDLSSRLGARAEWRRYRVNTEDLFDPASRTGRERTADRLFASLYWKL